MDNQKGVFLCGQCIFHPQSSVDDISHAAADDFAVIHRLHSLYDYCENLPFYLRGFLCPSLADTLCMRISSNKKEVLKQRLCLAE